MDMQRLAQDTCSQPDFTSTEVLPDYLVRHYNWAYVWPFSVWFFDHQPIINAILFGNYRRIMDHTLRMMRLEDAGKTLQIAAVYGELTPKIAEMVDQLYLMDAAGVQLRAAARKLQAIGRSAHLGRMHAENLDYAIDSFDTSLMFLLLHELPPESRRASLAEALRVTRPGGRLVISEYGEVHKRHFLHRFAPMRWILTTAEPFLGGFWNENLVGVIGECAATVGKSIEVEEQVDIFGGFYRVASFRVN
ncbi:MAG: methyltransferase domain-containing protein [Wenzhouxiangellaceae bacterium]